MTLELPLDKRRKVQDQVRAFKKVKNCTIKEFAQLIGLLVSCCPAIQYSWVHIKSLEREKYLALLRSKKDYEGFMVLSQSLQEDFLWWEQNIEKRVSSIANREFRLTIFSDASRTGWGAACGKERTHGFWSDSDKLHHINFLELLAAFFGLQCFALELRNCNILLRIDNTTAISYINRMGDVRFKKLSNLAKSIWRWCEDRELFIFASYISSKDNADADFESRRLGDGTEFELSETVFRRIVKEWGLPEIDLFATRINTKCKDYVSWIKDPGAIAGAASSLEDAYPGGRKIIREAFLINGIPEEAIKISMASLSESSLKQYDSSLRKWWFFCKSRELSLYKVKIADIIKFLTLQFDRGASYGSLNCIRSAISLIAGTEIGRNESVMRFFRGISKLRPPEPKYDSTWDPKTLLDFLKKLPNNTLSLAKLSKKLIALLALVTGQRIQTLSLIDIRNIVIREDLIEIKIPDRIKTSRPGLKQPLLVLPVYEKDPNICPVRTLQVYLQKTQDLRKDINSIFISFKRPFKKVSSQTLSRWLKDILHSSGIDTDIFSAHSTRHASTSAARRKGVNIDIIRKSAGWTKESATFARFYDRPIGHDVKLFGQAILD
ncbi:PREDICTED: uncharacterized protein LOC108770722 [Trachymyrmex cornetzi]|uniref:uncharacterized protein LOC108770722 n=1 Tax=Trachymyrmex cornetzi TaxID=471704 RepID=UPI00084F4B52|nr:PREDICTED: uncharacterized protein LOC108770722 [Trachymyrmex cornetzi]